jgi:hypothetical protein
MKGALHSRLTRFQAFGIHLTASLFVFFALLGVLILVWYPGPIFALEGGWKGLRIVALVDVVLGPLLTLVLFKPGKPGLKLDMSLIVAFQLAALGWGVHTLYNARPALLVFADESFRTVSYSQIQDIDPGGEVLERWAGPSLARLYVDLPDELAAFADLLAEQRRKGRTAHMLFERYQPLEAAWDRAVEDSLDVEDYVSEDPSWRTELDALTASLGRDVDELVFFPYIGRYDRAILVADADTREFVDVLDIPYDPAIARKKVPLRERPANQPAGAGDTGEGDAP